MSSFKFTITLESEFNTQELADFFAALAQNERGNVQPLMRILHPREPPPTPPASPQVDTGLPATETAPVPATVVATQTTLGDQTPQQVPEPTVTDALKRALTNTEISCQRLNTIIRRHNWARGQKAQIERRWGFSKASCFARIGFHFNDYSILDGSVSTEVDLLRWVRQRGFSGTL
jgi:hypothetical protein